MSKYIKLGEIEYFISGHGTIQDFIYAVAVKREGLDTEKKYLKVIDEDSGQFEEITDESILKELQNKHEIPDYLKDILP